MTTSVTGKLNRPANKYDGQNGATFFVEVGEQNYNFKAKEKQWTNYSAALFAKDNQANFYESALTEGAIVTVSGTGIIIDMPDDPKFKPRLQLQDAKLTFVHNPGGQAPPQQAPPQQYQQPQQPQQAPQQQYQQPQQAPQQAPQQQYAPQSNRQNGNGTQGSYAAPSQSDDFDDSIPFN